MTRFEAQRVMRRAPAAVAKPRAHLVPPGPVASVSPDKGRSRLDSINIKPSICVLSCVYIVNRKVCEETTTSRKCETLQIHSKTMPQLFFHIIVHHPRVTLPPHKLTPQFCQHK